MLVSKISSFLLLLQAIHALLNFVTTGLLENHPVNSLPEKHQAPSVYLCSRTFLIGVFSLSPSKRPIRSHPPLSDMRSSPGALTPLSFCLSHLNFCKSTQLNTQNTFMFNIWGTPCPILTNID